MNPPDMQGDEPLDLALAQSLWLTKARHDFERRLKERLVSDSDEDSRSPGGTLRLAPQSLSLLALDPTYMERFKTELRSKNVNELILFGPASGNCPQPPTESTMNQCLTEISQLLASIDSIKSCHLIEFSAPEASILLSGCRHMKNLELFLAFMPPSEPNQESIRSLAEELRNMSKLESLRVVRLGGRALFIIIASAVKHLPLLRRLCLSSNGSSFPMEVSSPAETATFCDLLLIPSLQELTLEGQLVLQSKAAANTFCAAVQKSSIQILKLVASLDMPETDCHTKLASALGNSKLIHLNYHPLAPDYFMSAFSLALSESPVTQLERLSIFAISDPGTRPRHFYFHSVKQVQTNYDNDDWLFCVKRTLESNIQRRLTLPLFRAIEDAPDDATSRKRFIDALEAVDLPLAYECFRRNRCSSITLIKDFASN